MGKEQRWHVTLGAGIREPGCAVCRGAIATLQDKPCAGQEPQCGLCGARLGYAVPVRLEREREIPASGPGS